MSGGGAFKDRMGFRGISDAEADRLLAADSNGGDPEARIGETAAFPPLLALLPGGSPLARAAARLPGLTEAGYGLVAGNRGKLGRLVPAGAKRRADARIRRRAG